MKAPDLARLQAIVARLRAPDGCPWDRRQSLASMRHYLLEEVYEVLDVMTSDAADAHCEELGDLLFQIVFQAQLRQESGAFELADAVEAISDKLIRRHPHVFGDEDATDAAAVKLRWEVLKRAEGKGGIEAVPRALPALMRAEALGKKAAGRGFDWPSVTGALEKVSEELGELHEAIADGASGPATPEVVHELGDLLFSVVNVARHVGVHPEEALAAANDRFLARFMQVTARVEAAGARVEDVALDALEAHWQAAKAELG